jgi:DNA-binding GntR family transcriptional regulator
MLVSTQNPAFTPRPAPPGTLIYSPQIRSGAAAYRLFCGDVPPTLSIRDQVAIAVAERVIEHKLGPGERIREQLLSEEFNVSKAPVSEALSMLEHAGLVESSSHRSAYVSQISAQDFDELVEYRGTLARTFVPHYVARHTRQDNDLLEQYIALMTELVPYDDRSFEFIELSDRCLLFVAMQGGNRRISRAMSHLSLQMLRYVGLSARTVKQRRHLVNRWNESLKIVASRNAEQVLAHFELTVRERIEETRAAIPTGA